MAVTVLQFFLQYGRHDVILPAKSLKTQIHITYYLGEGIVEISFVIWAYGLDKNEIRYSPALAAILKKMKKIVFDPALWKKMMT